jgi:hypothetical protein
VSEPNTPDLFHDVPGGPPPAPREAEPEGDPAPPPAASLPTPTYLTIALDRTTWIQLYDTLRRRDPQRQWHRAPLDTGEIHVSNLIFIEE